MSLLIFLERKNWMNVHETLSEQQLLEKKESYYIRNFLCLMMEGFLFTFSLTMFSPENVLPVYVSSLSQDAIYLAMISAVYYGFSYGCTIFSCVIGLNAKSPKWISILVCFLQRIGFFMIFLSTYLVSGNRQFALAMFFVSLALYATSAGMSNPLFAQMVGTSIHRNVGTFYGGYSMSGAISGVIASLLIGRCLERYTFPKSFQVVFLLGLVSALLATLAVAVGVREVTDDRKREHIRLRDIFPISAQILRENKPFRHFTVLKVLVGAAEFAIPYYIIVASALPGTPASFVGTMTTVYLVSKVIGSLLLGRLADRFGAIYVMRWSCISGAAAALMAILVQNYRLSFLMYGLLAVAVCGVTMANNVACIAYSKNVRTPIYTATTGLLCAPLYIVSSFLGAAIVNRFSYTSVFVIAMGVYALCAILTFFYRQPATEH